jgi:ABC-type transport system involved in multi-copper enzyme maturation permease subunit
MIGIIRSEWVKLRRPAYLWVPLSLTTLFVGLFTVLPILNAEATPPPDRGGPPAILIDEFTASHGAVASAKSIYGLIGMIVLVIFSAAIATEFSNGTIRNLLIREPRRVRLMLGRWLALVLWALLPVLVLVVVGVVAGVITMATRDLSTGAWFETPGLQHIASTILYLWISIALFGTFGAILALLLKTPVAAIGIGIAFFLIVENLLGGLLSGTSDWLPGNIISSVASGGNYSHGFWDGLALILGYLALLGGVALAWFNRSDVTS